MPYDVRTLAAAWCVLVSHAIRISHLSSTTRCYTSTRGAAHLERRQCITYSDELRRDQSMHHFFLHRFSSFSVIMSIFCLRTDADPWRAPTLSRLDSIMQVSGAHLICFDWTRYNYVSDGLHFTRASQADFSRDMAECLAAHFPTNTGSLYIVTDSTVDHAPMGYAMLEQALRNLLPSSTTVTVDAVCGSGFVLMGAVGLDFGSRVRQAIRRGDIRTDTMLVLMGGWNDVGVDEDHLSGTALRLLGHVQRHMELGERRSKIAAT